MRPTTDSQAVQGEIKKSSTNATKGDYNQNKISQLDFLPHVVRNTMECLVLVQDGVDTGKMLEAMILTYSKYHADHQQDIGTHRNEVKNHFATIGATH